MKTTDKYNLQVPELGDRPNITRVSNAIEALEDAIAGNIEVVSATVVSNQLDLTPIVRTTSRTKYYEGLTLHFKAPKLIQANSVTRVKLDNLPIQVASMPFLINSGDMVELVYTNNKFEASYFTVPKSSSISSSSEINVATSKAAKSAYDRGTQAYQLAETKEPIISKKTGFNLDKSDSVTSTSSTTLATAKAAKTAYDRGSLGITNAATAQARADSAYSLAGTKETVIAKKTGFNLDKSDSVTSTSSTTLATSKAIKTAYDKGVSAYNLAKTKEPIISKKTGFNLDKSDSLSLDSSSTLATSKAVKTAYDKQVARLSSGGYVEVTDIDTDFILQIGYYEGVDSQGTQFSVRVDSTLEIPENSPIKDVSGYVRLQGVKMPCKLAIREYPTLTDNTAGLVLLEIESNFENSGDTEAIKSLVTDVGLFQYGSDEVSKLDRGNYQGTAEDLKSDIDTKKGDFIENSGFNKVMVDVPEDDSTKVLSAKGLYDYCPYNVNDIYLTMNSENPSTVWNGTTWEKIEGKFLLGTSTSHRLGTGGGSDTHKLTINEIPSHNHKMFSNSQGSTSIASSSSSAVSYKAILRSVTDRDDYHMATNKSTNATLGATGSAGGSQSFSIMPPFLAVNMWKRLS